ncbi:dihydrodipicolinate synthase family protein [Sphingobacterium alkalisoli]|uniref:Dihydrodipicolinate synthase family protein n=1 Tax=Sphingobacterium alkalisoli TaxID=1874115 RepID=A0A4V5LX80_9SPHI|nr:dihydrodipicolinate synthase family protein [Sphingobacterium alkalisoli]TJY61469.1 dihydrodipicolinate synthase family protein [Sphingobacterium alkalisoli]GGH30199.1 dihydrodipicolinate synthetase [Sphingobacterium alkalisoli]
MKTLSITLKEHLLNGTVIPAHPLALHEDRTVNEAHQRLLTNYYMASGAGGIAVAVHSTQFEIRDPKINLFETVLKWAAEEVEKADLERPFVKVAGICGPTEQAINEAKTANKYGYDIGLLSMGGLQGWTEEQVLDRVKAVAQEIPVFGFYLQPSVGGRVFTYGFWQKFVEIENVVAIKCASFNRYQTLDVMRALANSSRPDQIAMYTGNDDNIINDLMSAYVFPVGNKNISIDFKGGLLGHWAVWTHKAVELLEEIKQYKKTPSPEQADRLLSKAIHVTDTNAAFFDPAHNFHGCIPGIHEVLRRQGLLKGIWCLNPKETLSPGQSQEIDRVYKNYPTLNDDQFVKEFLTNYKKTL